MIQHHRFSNRLVRATFLGSLMGCSTCALAQTYQVTELGSLGGPANNGVETEPTAINATGEVVGYATNSGGTISAVLWNGITPTILAPLDNTNYSVASAINGSGEIVGYSYTANGPTYATVWNGASVTALSPLAGYQSSWATGITDSGQVVGYSLTPGGIAAATTWNGSSATALGTFGGYTETNGINSSGQVAGIAVVSGGATHAIRWSGTTPTDLGTLAGGTSVGFAIDSAGQVVGYSDVGSYIHATLWNGTSAKDLGTFGGNPNAYSYALGINNVGQVVGYSGTTLSTVDAALWENGEVIDLNTVASGSVSLFRLVESNGINDNGLIIASGVDSQTGLYDSYLLTPNAVPLPPSAWLLLSGLGGLGFFARRRKSKAHTNRFPGDITGTLHAGR